MADNRKALVRYLAYDRCLSNPGRRYGWQDLLGVANQALLEENLEGISKSQFYNDINFLINSEWQAPIETYYDGGHKKYYRYSDPSFSIKNKKELSEYELDQLKSAISILSRFRGSPQFDWLYDIIPTLEEKLGVIKTDREIISLDSNVDYVGNKWLPDIFNAAVNKRVLEVTYKPFHTEKELIFNLHPHYLKQYNGRWFAFGLNSDEKIATWNTPLDRIINIKETDLIFEETQVDWEDHFYDMIGVTRKEGQEAEKINLWISNERWPYVETKPIHASQKVIKKREDGVVIEINVIRNFELQTLINSFGDDVNEFKA